MKLHSINTVVKTQRSDVTEAGVSEAVRPPAAALVRGKWRGQGWNVDLEALENEMCVLGWAGVLRV